MSKNTSFAKQFIQMYYSGFKNMSTWGKQVWLIIIIKLIIMFAILKVFFFPNFLKSNFKTDEQRTEHVLDKLTNKN